MRILVVNGFIREAVGDAALLCVLLQQLNAAFPGSSIVVSSLEDPKEHPEFEGYRNIGSSRRYGASEEVGRARRAIRKAFLSVLGRVWFNGPHSMYRNIAQLLPPELRDELSEIEKADLVVSVGGGYLNGTKTLSGNLTVDTTLLPLKLAKRLGKGLICAPQSFGPFGTKYQRRAVRAVVGAADRVLVREDISVQILADLGLADEKITRGVDSAFALTSTSSIDWRSRFQISSEDILVGLTARQWLSPSEQDLYERRLAQLVDYIEKDAQRQVVLIPQVISSLAGEDDRYVNRRIAKHCAGRQPILIEDIHDYRELADLYRQLDFMVGMRFHSVIFALTHFVPSIAIEYHHKAAGIMADLSLTDWVVPVDALERGKLEALFEELVANRRRYIAHLRAELPEYIECAKSAQDIYRAVYREHEQRNSNRVDRAYEDA